MMKSGSAYRNPGSTTCYMVFGLGVVYAIITAIGLISLDSPSERIDDPYFTIMEILSILISLLMVISMVAVHNYAAYKDKFFSLTALALMFVTTTITSSVHFVILSMSSGLKSDQLLNHSLFFSFKWPSVAYALDILAWDLFFGLAMLFMIPIFRFNKMLQSLLTVAGILSLVGLIGVPLQNMEVRNIGIIGYAIAGPVSFLLIGKILGRTENVNN